MHGLDRPATHCVHFVRTGASSEVLAAQVEAAGRVGVKFAYWNYLHGWREAATLLDPLGIALSSSIRPMAVHGFNSWMTSSRWLTDMMDW